MKSRVETLWEALLLAVLLGAFGIPAHAQTSQSFSWTVTGTGTETWYSDDMVFQTPSISISMPTYDAQGFNVDGCESQFWTVTAPITATTYFQYALSFGSAPADAGGGSANVYIRDQTTGTDIFYDETSNAGIVHNGSFAAIAGHTYVFTVHACGYRIHTYSTFSGYGSSQMSIQMPDHYQHNQHTATRTASATGTNFVNSMTTGKDIGGFSAPPQTQNGGTISGVSYALAGNNTNAMLLFSDTKTTNTANSNADIIAAWVPTIQGLSVKTLTSIYIEFQIPQAFTTNYSVGGYYVANGITNNFGTGYGPSVWGLGPLVPNTAYSFFFWGRDLVNNFSGPTISTNVTTLPVPTLQGLSVAAITTTNVTFQIPQALTTNYSVAGYYVSGGVTNNFAGTGSGPSIWAIGSLQPNKSYAFSFWERDLVNSMSSATVTTNVSTLPVPGYNQVAAKPMGGGKVQLSFVGDAGAKYALERSAGLSPANWVPQVTNPAGVGGVLVFTNTPNAVTNNFWRIRFVP